MMRKTGSLMVVLCMLAACGGQETETPSAPPPAPAAKPPAAANAPAATAPPAAKALPKVNPVMDERRNGTVALRDPAIRTALALTPDQTAKLEKLGDGSFNVPINQADLAYAVLTPEQHTKLRQEMAKRAGPQVLTLPWVQEAVGLDDIQRAKVAAIYKTQTAAVQAIAKKPDATPDEKRAEVMKLVASVQAAAEGLLTPEQKQKLTALRGDAPAQS